jgi:hypothetical protein
MASCGVGAQTRLISCLWGVVSHRGVLSSALPAYDMIIPAFGRALLFLCRISAPFGLARLVPGLLNPSRPWLEAENASFLLRILAVAEL